MGNMDERVTALEGDMKDVKINNALTADRVRLLLWVHGLEATIALGILAKIAFNKGS